MVEDVGNDPRVWVGYGSKKQKTHWPASVVRNEDVPIPLQVHAKPDKVCVMFYGPPKNKAQKVTKSNASFLERAIQEVPASHSR
eukprot:jgi/Pico_ML_1/52276/g3004.t2